MWRRPACLLKTYLPEPFAKSFFSRQVGWASPTIQISGSTSSMVARSASTIWHLDFDI
jgi:hypothetical protein